MPNQQLVVGSEVRISATLTNSITNQPADANASFKVRSPSGVETTYVYGVDSNVGRDAVGQYHADVLITEQGTWRFRFVASGGVRAARECTRETQQTHFVNPI